MKADQPPNEPQRSLAEWLNVDLSGSTRRVAAARLKDAVSPATEPDEEIRAATERQNEIADELGIDVSGDSYRVAFAKIGEEIRRRRRDALQELKLEPGDRVRRRIEVEHGGERHVDHREFTVSSIGDDLMVYFKGGGGKQASPTELERVDGEPEQSPAAPPRSAGQ